MLVDFIPATVVINNFATAGVAAVVVSVIVITIDIVFVVVLAVVFLALSRTISDTNSNGRN